jgi:NAD(P)-dependent dehydrogenase (short-subunit alcohol dehydrogenase family)
MKPALDITLEEFDKLMAVNVRGVFLALQEAARRIEAGGRIVNLSSVVTNQSQAGGSVYAASKAAVEQFTRTLAKELGAHSFTVNAVAPGATETDMMPTRRYRGCGCLHSQRRGSLAHRSDRWCKWRIELKLTFMGIP